jgi:LytS/YehU family sensor histidine kinase
MELAFLKSQVDPHFLFNTLNNIYALALEEKADRTADGVAKMGTLMRYTLHDSQADRILLQKEITYIEKYIELQRIRIAEGANVKITTNFDMDNVGSEKIAPMMLIPFIENAFKYGISAIAPSYILVDLRLESKTLLLQVRNSVHDLKDVEQGGIGLKNVQNRLRLLYPGRHRLACEKSAQEYTVHLELDLMHD